MTDQQVFVIRRGDQLPAFRAQCLDGADPVDLSTATAKFIMRRGATVVVNATATIEPGPDGWVNYNWQSVDTATAGTCYGEIEITWPGSRKQTFPPDRNVLISIVADIA